jgi:hypothetical protein
MNVIIYVIKMQGLIAKLNRLLLHFSTYLPTMEGKQREWAFIKGFPTTKKKKTDT